VTRANQSVSPDQLRDALAQSLPHYMVPARTVFLDSLPLTNNGKVDRKALPDPLNVLPPRAANDEPAASHAYNAPRNKTEETLASIFAGLLNVERVGINDDFFDLGGHSLMAIRAVNKIRGAFGVELPLTALLQAPTVAELAELVKTDVWVPSWKLLVPLRAEGSRPPLILFHAHGGNVLEYQQLANRLDPDQPVYAFQARGLDGHIIRGASLQEMAAAYIEELKTFQPRGPYYLGGFCLGGLLALEAAQQLTAAGHRVALLVIIQSIDPAAMRFRPDVNAVQRWWYKLVKRADLERARWQTGHSRIADRLHHAWDAFAGKAVIKWDELGNIERDPSEMSMRYILTALGEEHQKAMMRYEARPYSGDVLLFRASKQLKGQVADEMLGWNGILRGNVEVREVQGHQQQLLVEPAVSQIAMALAERLKKRKLRVAS
jgi:thioesterase domain-containing protein/acyl carrier protein